MDTHNKLLTLILTLGLMMANWPIIGSADQVRRTDPNMPDLPIRGAPESDLVGLGTRYDAEAIINEVLRRQLAKAAEPQRTEEPRKLPGAMRGMAETTPSALPQPSPTPQIQEKQVTIGNQATENELNLTRREKQAIQAILTDKGFDTLGVDGIFGNNTRAAIRRFQRANRTPDTGYLSASQLELLLQ